MKTLFFLVSFFMFQCLQAQQRTYTVDKNWSSQSAEITNSLEADYIIRIGDIDNLNFGWPDDFDPFCGRMTQAHSYPWEASKSDLPGFDCILLSSKFAVHSNRSCGGDGYTDAYNNVTSKPMEFILPLKTLVNAQIQNAYLQFFIDDFQAPSMCSKFSITLNGKRFVEAEKLFNAIDQTGPVGKLVTIPVPEEFYADMKGEQLKIKVDETTGAADGFALDFIRLLVNRKRENTCKGTITGIVRDKATDDIIANATVFLSDNTFTTTNKEGNFSFQSIPTGFEVVSASFKGYADGSAVADIGEGDDNAPVTIYLEKGVQAVLFNNQKLNVGESIQLNKILFDQGKADLRPESKPELDKIVAFLKQNPAVEIELEGHTSAEGDRNTNKSLSYKRVKACKDYILLAGIDAGRIVSVGYGPDKPIAPNDTETNRAKNRRVEMRILKG